MFILYGSHPKAIKLNYTSLLNLVSEVGTLLYNVQPVIIRVFNLSVKVELLMKVLRAVVTSSTEQVLGTQRPSRNPLIGSES